MCGITGISYKDKLVNTDRLWSATDTLAHRGPDDRGIYISRNQRSGLGHRRLSFIDVSASGRQPLSDTDRMLHVTFNGEIYNYQKLRRALEKEGCHFTTKTDTEVLLHGYKIWGDLLPYKLDGMFAFAIFDEEKQAWFLCRDRFGIKPLYYAFTKNTFLFGSEIKAILAYDAIEKQVRPESISLFLANRYVPCPQTIWRDIYQVHPGHFIHLNMNTWGKEELPYWTLTTNELIEDQEASHVKFIAGLKQAVQSHLTADVPVGSFLSGGYDSSALVYMMQKELNYPTEAFAIGFKGWESSEDKYAAIVAETTGAKLHTALSDDINISLTQKLMWHYDNPIADISIIPTFVVSQLASKHVKAVLSGEGADEALGGYWWHKSENWYKYNTLFRKILGYPFQKIKQHYIHAMSMGLFDKKELYQCLTPSYAAHIPDDPFSHFNNYQLSNSDSILKQLQYLDVYTFMADLVLPKIDRASMANSLEVRVPFLQHDLMQSLFSLSNQVTMKKGVQKFFLHQWLKNKLPDVILNRCKQGFVGPDIYYMNVAQYESSLSDGLLIKQGVIKADYLKLLIQQKDHWRLWKIYVLESWWKVWMSE